MAKKALRWRNGSPTRRINNKLKRYEKTLNAEMFVGLRSSVDLNRTTMIKNAFVAKTNKKDNWRVSPSDSHTGRPIRGKGNPRRIVTRKLFKSESRGIVRIKPYYTGARTIAVKSLFTKYGQRDKLTRTGLKVKKPWTKKRARFIRFDQDSELKKWAIKRKMIAAQKVRLTDGRIVRDMLIRPSLTRNAPFMRQLFKSAFIRAGLRIKT